MTPAEFIKKWKPVALTERAAAHTHFLDLCKLFEHEDPVAADPPGEWFAFEKEPLKPGAAKALPMSGRRISLHGSTRKRSATSTSRWNSSCATPLRWKIRRFKSFAIPTVSSSVQLGPTRFRNSTRSNSTISRSRKNANSMGCLPRPRAAAAQGNPCRPHQGGGRQILHDRAAAAGATHARGSGPLRQPARV